MSIKENGIYPFKIIFSIVNSTILNHVFQGVRTIGSLPGEVFNGRCLQNDYNELYPDLSPSRIPKEYWH